MTTKPKRKPRRQINRTTNNLLSRMPITGYVLDKDGYLAEYEITPVNSLMYCTKTMIAGLEGNE